MVRKVAAPKNISVPSAVAQPAGQAPTNPWLNGGQWGPTPVMNSDLTFRSIGSSGLKAYGGWVRETFLPQLIGRQGARVYREMLDNSATVGAIMFAIMQTMRTVDWHVDGPDDSAQSQEYVEFVEGCMDDMSNTWNDFITEVLSMLPFGYAPHEIIYKKRMGRNPPGTDINGNPVASSKFNDGKIGIRRMPIRGQDTILKWFFDADGGIQGVTQQPWVGPLIDIPIDKMLLFRPSAYKNNPEGNSVLRNSYRSYYFIKRLEEQEAIMFERFAGFPVMTVPNALLEGAASGDPLATQALAEYKRIVTNARIDEQMGAILPSDTYKMMDGSPSNVAMYEFKLVSPTQSKASVSAGTAIERYKLEIMTNVLADFLQLGHSSRGTQSLGMTKVDLFFQALQGWMQSAADVLNTYLLPRLWELNGFNEKFMPRFRPDMPQRIDLDALSNFVLRLQQSGMITPNQETEAYLRDAAGLPDIEDISPEDFQAMKDQAKEDNTPIPAPGGGGSGEDIGANGKQHVNASNLSKIITKSLITRMQKQGKYPMEPLRKVRKRRLAT